MRVLLVDDDRNVLRALGALLKDTYRHEVRTALGGREALGVLKEWVPDAVVSDLMMEPMDGLSLGLEISTRADLDGVRLVVLSGFDDAERRFAAKQAGFAAFLTKPVSGRELDEAIRGQEESEPCR